MPIANHHAIEDDWLRHCKYMFPEFVFIWISYQQQQQNTIKVVNVLLNVKSLNWIYLHVQC